MNKLIAASFATLLLLTNCAKNISSSEYAEADVGSVKHTYKGVIISARPVKVQAGDSLEDNKTGLVGGGLAGGLLGSQIGQGRGQVVGLVLGAAAGAVGGSLLEKGLKSQEGIEYSVELNDGRILTLVQGKDNPLSIGQRVLVMVGSKGRSRIIPDLSPATKKSSKPVKSNAGRKRTVVVIEE
ncbi:MAG: glycine zipper 2TM domain-containing protein [Alphaproteobacteria bacterium]